MTEIDVPLVLRFPGVKEMVAFIQAPPSGIQIVEAGDVISGEKPDTTRPTRGRTGTHTAARWTPEEDQLLLDMWVKLEGQQDRAQKIMSQLGRTYASITSRVRFLDASTRPQAAPRPDTSRPTPADVANRQRTYR